MQLFGKRKSTSGNSPWAPPSGLVTTPQQLTRSLPFVYDPNGTPAFNLLSLEKPGGLDLSKGSGLDLSKGYDAAKDALGNRNLKGLRMRVIFLVDGSGSMMREYREGLVQLMLTRGLGFTLNVVPTLPGQAEPQIPVIVYGGNVNKPVLIGPSNLQQAPTLIRPDFASTAMTEAFEEALRLAGTYDMLTLVVNITDGNPNKQVTMSNAVIRSSGGPVMLKNLAIKPVEYLEEIDDLPSQYEIAKNPDESPKLDTDGNLVIVRNPQGIRLIDNVDSKGFDPRTATADEFAGYMADEIGTCVEVMGRVGILTNVPGITRTFF